MLPDYQITVFLKTFLNASKLPALSLSQSRLPGPTFSAAAFYHSIRPCYPLYFLIQVDPSLWENTPSLSGLTISRILKQLVSLTFPFEIYSESDIFHVLLVEGCCNDARLMLDVVRDKGFEEENIKLLVDDDDDHQSPDHVNVKNALSWLCKGRSPGDIIFMHFSGHGTQVPADDDDEESDKLDEAICLEGLFLMADDDLKQFFSELPEGVRATVVMDCCHSGSMLDGEEVAIEGAKDAGSGGAGGESDSLLSILGGSRDLGGSSDVKNRSLPLSTIVDVMSTKLGRSVDPSGSGVNGAMAEVFGGDAGKLMLKFAMSKLSKQDGGSNNALVGMLGGLLGGGSSKTTSSSNPLSALLGGGGSSQSSSNPLSSLLGGGGSSGGGNPLSSFLGGGGSSGGGSKLSSLFGGGGSSAPDPTPQSQNPMAMIQGLLGGMGLQGQESSGAQAYNPQHNPLAKDVCTLITGCQSDETSADVRPPGGDAYGALTKTLTNVYAQDKEVSYYDLVSGIRKDLSVGGYKQNPCLECSMDAAGEVFIC